MVLFSIFAILVSTSSLSLANIPSESNNEGVIWGKIHVRLHRNGDSSDYSETALEDLVPFLESSVDFDRTKPITLLFHGLNMKADNRIWKGVVDAFGKSGKWSLFNVMVMQMEKLFKNDLPNKCDYSVVQYAERAGHWIGHFLGLAVDAGLTEPDKMNFVGYSIGAHTAGHAARKIALEHSLVKYIVALDPAGFGFCLPHEWELGTEHLTHADARDVHMFHTNAYYYGSGAPLGTADFYFNNGYIQPGCYLEKIYGCSHARAVYFFTEVILKDGAFVGRHCGNFASFSGCLCDLHDIGSITFPPDDSLEGVYYVRTRDVSPYGLGLEGANCYLKIYWEWITG